MADSRPTWTEFYEMKRKAEKFYTEKEFWRNRAQTAEGDLKRCQDALDPTPEHSAEYVLAARWRVGRRVGRCIHMMVGTEPSEQDVLIGVFDTPEMSKHIVDLHNAAGRHTQEPGGPVSDHRHQIGGEDG